MRSESAEPANGYGHALKASSPAARRSASPPSPRARTSRRRSARPDRRSSSESSARSRCAVSVSHATSSCARVTGSVVGAQHIQQPTADLAVGARVASARGAQARPTAGSRPTATRRRSTGTARSAASAPCTRSRPAPSGRSKTAARHASLGSSASTSARSRTLARGVGPAVHGPGDHAAHVGVDDGNPLAVGEAGDRPARCRRRPRAASAACRRRRAPRRRARSAITVAHSCSRLARRG